jgi:hypothetical protein
MRRTLRGLALSGLFLTACGGEGLALLAVGVGVGFWYGGCDGGCYDDQYDDWYPASIATSDFDHDGTLDLAVADGKENVVWLLRGQPGGGFAGPPRAQLRLSSVPAQVGIAHAYGSGSTGLVVLNRGSAQMATYAGDGAGGFALVTPPGSPTALSIGLTRFAYGALDGEAVDDVVTIDERGGLHVSLGGGDGVLDDVGRGDPAAAFLGPDVAQRLAGVFIALANFDSEPGTDLVVLDGERSKFAIFPGHRDGTFGEPRVVTFDSRGDVLGIAAVTLVVGDPSALALLLGNRADDVAASTLAIVRASDGSRAYDDMPVGSARSIATCAVKDDGLTDLLLCDPVHGAIRTLRARR